MFFDFIDSGAIPIKGIRRLGLEPTTGTTALWATALWRRMDELMDEISESCSKVTLTLFHIFILPFLKKK
jgi:hypothetical protein